MLLHPELSKNKQNNKCNIKMQNVILQIRSYSDLEKGKISVLMKVEPGIILKLILNFSNFEPQYSYRLYELQYSYRLYELQYSYRLYSYKKVCILNKQAFSYLFPNINVRKCSPSSMSPFDNKLLKPYKDIKPLHLHRFQIMSLCRYTFLVILLRLISFFTLTIHSLFMRNKG